MSALARIAGSLGTSQDVADGPVPEVGVNSYPPMNEIVYEAEFLNDGWRNHERIKVMCAHRSAHVIHRKNEGKPSADNLFDAASLIGVKVDSSGVITSSVYQRPYRHT
jgi:hypothetical protein